MKVLQIQHFDAPFPLWLQLKSRDKVLRKPARHSGWERPSLIGVWLLSWGRHQLAFAVSQVTWLSSVKLRLYLPGKDTAVPCFVDWASDFQVLMKSRSFPHLLLFTWTFPSQEVMGDWIRGPSMGI